MGLLGPGMARACGALGGCGGHRWRRGPLRPPWDAPPGPGGSRPVRRSLADGNRLLAFSCPTPRLQGARDSTWASAWMPGQAQEELVEGPPWDARAPERKSSASRWESPAEPGPYANILDPFRKAGPCGCFSTGPIFCLECMLRSLHSLCC